MAVWVDVQKDPTDRSLPPFEFMILGAESSTAYSGAAAVHLVGALTGRAPEPRPIAGRGPTCLTSNEMFKSEVTRSRLGHLGLRARHENCGDIRDDTTQHSELVIGDGVVMVGSSNTDAQPRLPFKAHFKSPKSLGGANTQSLMVYIDDADDQRCRGYRHGPEMRISTTSVATPLSPTMN